MSYIECYEGGRGSGKSVHLAMDGLDAHCVGMKIASNALVRFPIDSDALDLDKPFVDEYYRVRRLDEQIRAAVVVGRHDPDALKALGKDIAYIDKQFRLAGWRYGEVFHIEDLVNVEREDERFDEGDIKRELEGYFYSVQEAYREWESRPGALGRKVSLGASYWILESRKPDTSIAYDLQVFSSVDLRLRTVTDFKTECFEGADRFGYFRTDLGTLEEAMESILYVDARWFFVLYNTKERVKAVVPMGSRVR